MREIARVFTRIGCLSFGGPIATFALLEKECVERLEWLPKMRFLELLAICKMLPGPGATMLVIAIGRERAGNRAGLLAGICFIAPAFALMLILSWLYQSLIQSPSFAWTLQALQAGAWVIIAASAYTLARPYLRTRDSVLWVILGAIGVLVWPRAEPLWIFAAGAIGIVSRRLVSWQTPREAVSLIALFWVCFQAGALVFGTGLAVIPLLENAVVIQNSWLTHSDFMSGLALGQVTPGPVVITATFVGWIVRGFWF